MSDNWWNIQGLREKVVKMQVQKKYGVMPAMKCNSKDQPIMPKQWYRYASLNSSFDGDWSDNLETATVFIKAACSKASNGASSEICRGITWCGIFTLRLWCKQGSSQQTAQCKQSKQKTSSSDRSRTRTRATSCRLCSNGGLPDACPVLPRGQLISKSTRNNQPHYLANVLLPVVA